MNRYSPLALIVLALLLLVALTWINSSVAAPAFELQVSYIDVGQGDAALIHGSDQFDVLIDGGKPAAGPTVVAYLEQQGIDDIDVMIASHADSDHIGGLVSVLEDSSIPVETVLFNGYTGTTILWEDFTSAVISRGLTLQSAQYPQTYTWGETSASVLNPLPGLVSPDTNPASIVLLLTHGNHRFLFTGDIDATVEATLVARGESLDADVLKVAHHGSKYSSSTAFLEAVSPEEAVISVGNNSYGHPAPETLRRLLEAGARIWRTDCQGTVVVLSNNITLTVQAERSPCTVVYLPIVLDTSPAFDAESDPVFTSP